MSWHNVEPVIRRTYEANYGKKYRRPPQKDGQVDVWFGKTSKYDIPDLCVQSGANAGGSPTRGFILGAFCSGHQHTGAPGYKDGFLEELESRGFDLTTLRFSIRKKA